MKKVITTFNLLLFLCLSIFCQDQQELQEDLSIEETQEQQDIKPKKKNEFRSGLILGAGFVDLMKVNEERDFSILTPYQNSGMVGLNFQYDFNLTNNIALSPRIDISGAFKRIEETFKHPRDDDDIVAESRIITGQGNIYPVQLKFGFKKVKLYGSFGWYFGRVFDYTLKLSGTADEDSLEPFHNESDKGSSIIFGLELNKFLLEGFVDYSNEEIIEGFKQKFIGARFITTI